MDLFAKIVGLVPPSVGEVTTRDEAAKVVADLDKILPIPSSSSLTTSQLQLIAGDRGFATGTETIAYAKDSTAMGNSTAASGEGSTAMGLGTIASGNGSIAMGKYNNPGPDGKPHLLSVGDGTAVDARSNVLAVTHDGTVVAADLECDSTNITRELTATKITVLNKKSFGSETVSFIDTDAVDVIAELQMKYNALVTALHQMGIITRGGGGSGDSGDSGGSGGTGATAFHVVLLSVNAPDSLNRIEVIKAVRDIRGIGLEDAAAVVDGAPSVIKEGVDETEANEIKAKLEAAGATVLLSDK